MTKKTKTVSAPVAPGPSTSTRLVSLRRTVQFLYDLQKMRIATGLRAEDGSKTAEISDEDKLFLGKMSDGMHDLEKQALKEVQQRLKGIPIYDRWLSEQKGCGPTMSGVILASFDIHKATTVSKMWAYAGLDPNQKKVKGQKLNYNPWLKSKLVKVLAESFIKCNSPWRKFYDDYKHRLQHRLVDCMLCEGTGVYETKHAVRELSPDENRVLACLRNGLGTAAIATELELGEAAVTAILTRLTRTGLVKRAKKADENPSGGFVYNDLPAGTCPNCKGEKRGPWGRSDAHRDAAAKRYMVKMFLVELYKNWREIEGLEARPPYKEEYLGRVHSTE